MTPHPPPGRGVGDFHWATGIEDSSIANPLPRTGRTLDEYELTQHYQFWREDLDRATELGVSMIRYGIPWHRVNPAPGTWDWGWTDRVLDYILEQKRLDPIVDLVHYGTPLWLDQQFVHPDYPQRVAEYAAAFAQRYGDRVRHYTPLNEPTIHARYAGRLGIWPPNLFGWRGWVRVARGLCRGLVLAAGALRAVQPRSVLVHVEAGELWEAATEDLHQDAAFREGLNYLMLDLVTGQVGPAHPLGRWVVSHGMPESDLDPVPEQLYRPDVLGVNYYPQWSRHQLVRRGGRLRDRRIWGGGRGLERLLQTYHDRYRCPVFVTETAARGHVALRARWLDQSVAAVRSARAAGVPVVGYTWWPLFALVAWEYRRGAHPLRNYLVQMGLWDLRLEPDGTLRRVRTRLVDQFRRYALDPTAAGGPAGPSGYL